MKDRERGKREGRRGSRNGREGTRVPRRRAGGRDVDLPCAAAAGGQTKIIPILILNVLDSYFKSHFKSVRGRDGADAVRGRGGGRGGVRAGGPAGRGRRRLCRRRCASK